MFREWYVESRRGNVSYVVVSIVGDRNSKTDDFVFFFSQKLQHWDVLFRLMIWFNSKSKKWPSNCILGFLNNPWLWRYDLLHWEWRCLLWWWCLYPVDRWNIFFIFPWINNYSHQIKNNSLNRGSLHNTTWKPYEYKVTITNLLSNPQFFRSMQPYYWRAYKSDSTIFIFNQNAYLKWKTLVSYQTNWSTSNSHQIWQQESRHHHTIHWTCPLTFCTLPAHQLARKSSVN